MHVRDRRRWWVALTAVTALVVGGLGAAVPAAAVDGFTYLQLDADTNDYASGGQDANYTAANAAFTWNNSANRIQAEVVEGAFVNYWLVVMVAPAGQELTAGTTYSSVDRPVYATDGQAGLQVDGNICTNVTGSITVHELEKDPVSGAVVRFAASFVQHCGGLPAALRGSIGYNATKVAPLLLSTTPASVASSGPVTVSGQLVDVNGPVAGAAIDVSRPDGAGGTTTLPATTNAAGAFSVGDTIGTSTRTYTVTSVGDATHVGVQGTITVAAVTTKSTLALTLPTTTVTRGKPYAVKGSLKGGSAGIPGVTVTLKRTDLSGTRTFYVKTTSSGAFVYNVTPTVGGKVTWTATWPGNGRYAKPVAPVRSMTVSRLASSLTMTTDNTVYSYKGTAAVKVHLGTTYNGRTVSIYALSTGMASRKLLKTGVVSSGGNLVVQLPILRRTVLSAVFAGDYRYLPATTQRVVTARSKAVITLAGAYGRSGSTYLYRVGENVVGSALVLPERAGECQKVVVQRLRGSTWETTTTGNCVWTNSSSTISFPIFTDSTWRRARVMVVVPTTREAVGVSTPWVYFTFT